MNRTNISINTSDLKRLEKLVDSGDNGFPILAMHSLIEREITKAASLPLSNSLYYTFKQLYDFIEPNLSPEQKKIILKISKDKQELTNKVRHAYAELTPDETNLCANNFFSFLDVFCPSTKQFPEYTTMKQAVYDALHDVKKISISEKTFKEMHEKIQKSMALERDYKTTIRDYKLAQNTIQELSQKLETNKDEYSKKVKDLNKKYDAQRKSTHLASEEKKKMEKEISKLTSEYKSREACLRAEIERNLKKLEEIKDIMEAFEFEQRCFSYSEGRRDYLRTPIALSPSQEKIVHSVGENSDFLIRGGAGSGKTIVLLEILKKLNQDKIIKNSCCFITYTKVLKYFSNSIMPDSKDSTFDISTVDALLVRMTKQLFNKGIAYGKKPKENIERILGGNKETIEEIELFIWAKNVTKTDYLEKSCARTGMKEGMDNKRRQEIWATLERAKNKIEANYCWPKGYAVVRLLEEFGKRPSRFNSFIRDYYLVDECQDLPLATIKLIKKLTRKAIYLAGDLDQSIYKKASYSFSEAGINIEGRTRILNECFRSTKQINYVCERYKDLAEIRIAETDMKSLRIGLPVGFVSGTYEECISEICTKVSNLLALDIPANDICILVYTNGQAKSVLIELTKRDIDALIINSNTIAENKGDNKEESFKNLLENDSVKIMTIFNAKGLEFPCVLFFAQEKLSTEGISGMNKQSLENLKKNLVYVAISRATSALYVFANNYSYSSSKAINLLGKAIKPEEITT